LFKYYILVLFYDQSKHSALKKALIGISTGIIVSMIFVFVAYQSIPGDFVGTPQFEPLKISGYDARDLNELTAHDGITMLKTVQEYKIMQKKKMNALQFILEMKVYNQFQFLN